MKKFTPWLRFLVSIGLIVLLFFFVDIDKAWEVLKQSSLPLVALAIGIYLLSFFVMGYRWKLLLDVHHVGISYYHLVKYYIIGFFFNNFLPTSIGGDVARVYISARKSEKKSECLAAIMIERIIGLLAIIALAIMGIGYAGSRLQNSALIWISVGLFLCVAFGLFFLMHDWGLKLLEQMTSSITRFGIKEKVKELCATFRLYRNYPKVLWSVFAVSIFYQSVMVLFVYSLNLATGLGVAFSDFFVCVPIVAVLGLLPSVNGLGVREGGYIYLLTRLGTATGEAVDVSVALSFSLMILFVGVFVSLLGGLVFALGRGRGDMDGIANVLHPTSKTQK